MKKLIICAAVAIAALASCTKTQVINTEDPQEIGFKVITGKMTKAEQTTNGFTQTLGVAAYLGTTDYFGGDTEFEKQDNGVDWKSETPKYWPLQSELDLVVWSPFDSQNITESNKTITFKVDNSSKHVIADQVDYLYGAKYYTEGKQENAVAVELTHALAKVTIKFRCENDVTVDVNKVALVSPTLKGTCTVSYNDNTKVATTPNWTNLVAENGDWNLTWTVGEITNENQVPTKSYDEVSVMVVPTAASNIKFNYTIAGMPATDAVIDLSTADPWAGGTHYVYAIEITPYEIKFTPSVTEWGVGGTTTTEL